MKKRIRRKQTTDPRMLDEAVDYSGERLDSDLLRAWMSAFEAANFAARTEIWDALRKGKLETTSRYLFSLNREEDGHVHAYVDVEVSYDD